MWHQCLCLGNQFVELIAPEFHTLFYGVELLFNGFRNDLVEICELGESLDEVGSCLGIFGRERM